MGDYYNNSLSNLPILYFNARSLLPKFDELLILCETYTPGIVCIVESWLSEDIEDSELIIPNYQVLRLDRNRHGGGILLYIHNSLTYSKGPSNLELMPISVGQASSTSKFCIGVFFIVHQVLLTRVWMIFILFWKMWTSPYYQTLFL